jgi:hypothetical protein
MKFMITLSSFPKFAGIAVAIATTLVAVPKSQAATIFYGDVFAGATQFDATVTASGNTVKTDTWSSLPSGTSVDRGDYTLSRVSGGFLSPTTYTVGGSPPVPLSGQVIDISPSSRNVQTSRASGIQFTFKGAVNALGFEVGDWGTCCQPSALYLSFDNGAPIQVGLSTVTGDAYLTNGGPGVFVGAIDDTNKFTTVQFWGDGAGEFLVAGGKIRYGDVAIGSISNSTSVPEPFTIVGTLIGATVAYRTRKRLKAVNKL